MEVIKISDWADDVVDTTVTYRKHTIEFTFRPGAYTSALDGPGALFSDVIAGCVTKWNVDCPLEQTAIDRLPLGAVRAVYGQIVRLATQADLGEAPASSPTG